MRLLLDTHVLIWVLANEPKIPTDVAAALKLASNEVIVSAITPWEISIKVELGKLTFDAAFLGEFDARMKALAFSSLPITSTHGVAAGRLLGRNRDPFDRMLAAQAISEGLILVTADRNFDDLNVPTMWS